ncbi:MAG: radical SAM protein [Thermodesulfobacteriota bacterium]
MRTSFEENGLKEAFSSLKLLHHMDRLQAMREGRIVPPVTVELDPTNLCNHHCIWCLDQRFRESCHDTLPWETVRRLIEELAQIGVKGVVVKGSGEPTLVPYFSKLFYAIRSAGLKSALTTNGGLLSGDKAKAVAECCDWVRVSVDAATAETHQRIHRPTRAREFRRVIGNIGTLVEMRERVASRLVIGYKFSADEHNLHEIVDAAILAREIGADNISIRAVDLACHGFQDKAFQAAQREIVARMEEAKGLNSPGFTVIVGGVRRPAPIRSCRASDLIGVVSANGHLYACCDLKGDDSYDMGDITQGGFEQVWQGPKRMEVRRRVQALRCRSRCSLKYDGYNQILERLLAQEALHCEFL